MRLESPITMDLERIAFKLKGETMQQKDQYRIARAWGNKPCNHPDWEPVYVVGTRDDELACTQCGKSNKDKETKKESN